ncbi:MAG: glycosyltransferase family 4 protein [Verrucomicrobiales bacterium]
MPKALNQELRTKNREQRSAAPIQRPACASSAPPALNSALLTAALLTGGGDKPYALGMAAALTAAGVGVDFIGSDDLDVPEVRGNARVKFLNLRGDQNPRVGAVEKLRRVLVYYGRLLWYAATARPRTFHLLWNNKFQVIDRTLVMLYYRLLGKRVVMTVHNVNAGERDGNDSWVNRATLRSQYALCDHLFVHTERMKRELVEGFGVPPEKASIIPFGINTTVPNTALTSDEARRRLGLSPQHKVMLFFGNIAPYKGLEYLVSAFQRLASEDPEYRLVVVGRPKECDAYWQPIEELLAAAPLRDRVVRRIEYVPDEETEVYFKAADILVLPYTHVFQSGVLFLSYGFGVPVAATDVGSLKDEIVEGETGVVCRPCDSVDLTRALREFFASEMYAQRGERRAQIVAHAKSRYSWDIVAAIITGVYRAL